LRVIIYHEFPARGELPPVHMTWYDGGLMPPAPAELPPGERLPDNRVLYIGSKGKTYHGSVCRVSQRVDSVKERAMPRIDVSITTRDGICPASVFTPSDSGGPWPAVIFFMDGLGIRPVMWEMGQRLADSGYLVLLPDLYYRLGAYPPMNPAQVLSDPKAMGDLMKFVTSLNRDRKVADAAAFIDFLSSRPDVKGDRFGATGYCMGGNASLTAAGAFPDRFAAAASFHGGNLATDQPDSPHLFLKKMTGRVYVAGAIEDAHFPEEQKNRLEKALTDAGVDHLIETYPGVRHGFAVPDLPVFNPAAAERHWKALFGLFHETLQGS
jgi:carboxymethylenebutenolidase